MLTTFIKALVALNERTFHYFASPQTEAPYIVWAEDGANDLVANNGHSEKMLTGTVDLFTREEADPLFQSIPEVMDRIPVAYSLTTVQYEEETGLIHYSWDWEAI